MPPVTITPRPVLLFGPPPPRGINPTTTGIANGYEPSALRARELARYANEILGKCRRVVYTSSYKSIFSADPAPASPVDTYRFRFRSSPGTTMLRVKVGLFPANSTTRTDLPGYYWTVNGVARALVSGNRRNTGTLVLQDVWEVEERITLTRDTAYQFVMTQQEHCRVAYVVAYEEPSAAFASTEAYLVGTGRVVKDGGIYDADVADFFATANRLWKRQGSHFFSWCLASGLALTTASATYVNALDTSLTSVTANSHGFPCQTYLQGTLDSNTIPVELYFVGKVSAGTGSVAFIDSSGTTIATLTTTSTSTVWVTGTASWANVGGWSSTKIDVHIKCSGGGTISVYAFGMYTYEA